MDGQDRIPTAEAQELAQRHGVPVEEPVLEPEPSAEVMRLENQADDASTIQREEASVLPSELAPSAAPEPRPEATSLPAESTSTSKAVATEAPRPPKGTQFIDESDVWLARVTFSGKLGRFIDELSGEETKELSVVPLLVSKSRVYFYDAKRDPDQFGEAVVLCKSTDAMAPADTHPKLWTVHGMKPVTVCMDCPFSQWGADKERPHCRINYNFLCVKPGETEPFRISFHSTSIRAVKQLLSQIKRSRRPMFSYIQHFRATEQKGPEGTYYSLDLGTPEWIPDADLAQYELLYDEMMKYGDAEVIDLLGGGRSIQVSGSSSSNGNGTRPASRADEEEVPF